MWATQRARIAGIPGVDAQRGSDISDLGASSSEVAMHLLEIAHVAVESGAFYGDSGEGHLRVCFGSEPMPRIEEAMSRIEHALTGDNRTW